MGYIGLDIVVANSESAARGLEESRRSGADVRVVPNGVYMPNEVTGDKRRRLKIDLGFSADDLPIGTLGRIDGNKNQGMLLRVLARLADKWRQLRLIIIGDGPMRHHLEFEAKKLRISERVALPGEMPRAAQYLPAMEICCLTSTTEGLPNLIMEASAAGLPVVSTNCGGAAELIDQAVTGYIVRHNDDLSMATYIDTLLLNPEHRAMLGRNGRQKMRREFSAEKMVARMTQVYEEAIAAKAVA
jgi:glycosyltransferase involved in cell wall biosynthesis